MEAIATIVPIAYRQYTWTVASLATEKAIVRAL